ncbi:MAG: DUF3499 family protein [Acidimicrobiia bacterium]
MPRRCERPGCSATAAVAYGFEAEQSIVWLEAVAGDDAETVNAGVLCRRHADALRPPRGWFLDDRREARPRLFRPPDEAVPAPGPKPRRERRAKALDTTEELPFGPFRDVADPDETEALPWTPVFDQTDDLGGLLAARSPLLSRAFGQRAPEITGPT